MPFDSESFNPAQWAREHERLDEVRFHNLNDQMASVFKLMGVAGMAVLAVLSWSLKAQYDGMHANDQNTRLQLQAIQNVQQQLSTRDTPPPVPKP